MKLIHCADLHLDSRMESGLPPEKARERRMELLHTFTKMVDMAAEDGVEAILLCGDLFDAGKVSVRARNCVLNAMRKYPQIYFYYLKGNHDREDLLTGENELPENLRMFGNSWKTYEQDGICITGAELSEENVGLLPQALELDAEKVNLVLLHGMASEYGGGADGIALRDFRDKGIDYLALGHIHSYQQEQLDDRGIWCYSGCLEGRGFDECGPKGYVKLEIEDGHVQSEFVPCACRTLHEVEADLTDCQTEQEMVAAAEQALAKIPEKDLVKLVLTGELLPELTPDVDWMETKLKEAYYFLKVRDQTRLLIRPEDYQYDVSLKGEFVRQVMASELSEEEKEEILRLGLRALNGEE